MIKKIFLLAALALPLFASAQTLKIGLVDTNSIIAAMPETTEAQNKLDELQKNYGTQFQNLEKEFQSQLEQYQNMSPDTPDATKKLLESQLRETQQKADAFQQNAMEDLQKKQNEYMAPILQKVRTAIESVGKEGSFSMIQEVQNALYFAAPVEDVTPLVKKKLGL